MSETDESNHSTAETGGSDPTMTWKEAKQLYDSGLVEVISHSDGSALSGDGIAAFR